MIEKLMKLGDKVRQIRKSFGYSQEKLADMVGVSLVSVSRIERNEQPPSLAFMAEFAKVCNVSVDSLLELARENEESTTIVETSQERKATPTPVASHGEFIGLVYQLAEAKNDSEKYQLTKSCIASYMELLDEKNRVSNSLEKLQRLAGKIKKR